MVQKLQRKLHEYERRRLRDLLQPVRPVVTLAGTLRWFFLWAGVLALCVLAIIKASSLPGGPAVVIPVVFVVGLLAFYFGYLIVSSHFELSRYARRFAREGGPQIQAALDHGGASVLSVTSNRVIVIEEAEDEGSAFIYDLGDGTSLYLRGQEYDPDDDGAPWPARHFEIVRTALDGRLVGIFGAKESVEPLQTVPMAEMPKNFWSSEEPQTETIIPGSPEEVLRRLGHAAEHGRCTEPGDGD